MFASRPDALVLPACFFGKIGPVEKPHDLRNEFFALVCGNLELNGETIAVDAGDVAVEAAEYIEIRNDAFVDLHLHGRSNTCAADRNILHLTGKFFAGFAHEAAPKVQRHAPETAQIRHDARLMHIGLTL